MVNNLKSKLKTVVVLFNVSLAAFVNKDLSQKVIHYTKLICLDNCVFSVKIILHFMNCNVL